MAVAGAQCGRAARGSSGSDQGLGRQVFGSWCSWIKCYSCRSVWSVLLVQAPCLLLANSCSCMLIGAHMCVQSDKLIVIGAAHAEVTTSLFGQIVAARHAS